MTTVNVYSKEQIDTKYGSTVDTAPTENSTNLVTSGGVFNAINTAVPPTTSASVGDVLTVGNSGAEWSTPSGGSLITVTKTTGFSDCRTKILSLKLNDIVMIHATGSNTSSQTNFETLNFIGYVSYKSTTSVSITGSGSGVYDSDNLRPNMITSLAFNSNSTQISITRIVTYVSGGTNGTLSNVDSITAITYEF